MPAQQDGTSRRAAMAKKRQSRRPSRLGTPAGAADKPDYVFEPDAGFPGLLKLTWRQATRQAAAPDLRAAVDTLLTLAGHVPADVQLRALRTEDECALKVLCGMSWRDGEAHAAAAGDGGSGSGSGSGDDGERPAFVGEIGLATSGRVVVRVPSRGPLASEVELIGGVIRVPWSAAALADYRREAGAAAERQARQVADCRRWLADAGAPGRLDLLRRLKEAALRTAPFVLYQGQRQYTNFRDHNTITGKTLWPGHPDCALSSLEDTPLELWSENDTVMVVCLTLLVRSVGFGRIEEANGTQLTLDHVAHLLERTRRAYNGVPGGRMVPPAASAEVRALDELAVALSERRMEIKGRVQLYREIHGALMHKIERVAGPRAEGARRREDGLGARLRERLPVTGDTLAEIGAELAAAPDWLARPHGDFGTGLESLVYETVAAATDVFEADFAMSRGFRSFPRLVRALREQDWPEIVQWEIQDYFCCVVPAPEARRHFGDSAAQLADTAWAMSSRMQYNSWHFIAGNLPRGPEVVARDHFVPPTIPDIAFFSDQHHHGHVTAKVRFSIRSPQAVDVLGRAFGGFVDLRLLRCDGTPFDEQDLLAAHRASALVARATTLAAGLTADGADVEVTSFDADWHWATVSARAAEPAPARAERP